MSENKNLYASIQILILRRLALPIHAKRKRTNSSPRDEFIRGSTLIKGLSTFPSIRLTHVYESGYFSLKKLFHKISACSCWFPKSAHECTSSSFRRDCFQSLTLPLCDFPRNTLFAHCLCLFYLSTRICKFYSFVNCIFTNCGNLG